MKPGITLSVLFAALVCMSLMTGSVSDTAKRTTEHYVPDAEEKAVWSRLLEQGVEKIAFVKRFTGINGTFPDCLFPDNALVMSGW
jgi:hypothetical protein